MIRLVERVTAKKQLLQLCEKTAFGCKISSIATAYGFDKSFALFWLDTEEDVVYCLVDGVMLLSGTVLNGEAARQFIRASGAKEILCAVRNAKTHHRSGTLPPASAYAQCSGDLCPIRASGHGG